MTNRAIQHARGNGLWADPNVPRWGWILNNCYDLGREPEDRHTCEMCEAQAVRYLHEVYQDAFDRTLLVGRCCAAKLTGVSENALRRAEVTAPVLPSRRAAARRAELARLTLQLAALERQAVSR